MSSLEDDNSKRIKLNENPSHLISIKELSSDFVTSIMSKAFNMKVLVKVNGGDDRLKHKVLASVFYEPSTRTSCSFQVAMLRLGGSVITVDNQQSSVKKGESLDDTIQTVSSYCDAVVLRHPATGSAAAAASCSTKPVINAGDGTGEHPTQALLDLFTIQSELGYIGNDSGKNIEEMNVVLLGDLKNGRTVHSLVYLLSRYSGIHLIYCSPSELSLPTAIFEELKSLGIKQSLMNLDDAIVMADVLYVTRIQKERFTSEEEYFALKGSYCIDNAIMAKAKEKMIIMHPLPRLDEISTEVDNDNRAAYFRQMENGMYVRMAILDTFLGNR